MSKKDEYRLQLKLSPREKEELEEAKLLSGARSYVQTVTEAVRRHGNVERERVLRMQELLKDK
jgi:hypothetical protein